jgi:PilZ domain-containing protein
MNAEAKMPERRKETRRRVIYGAVVAFNNRCSTMDCIVRDFSAKGAKVEIAGNALIPDHLILTINRKGQEFAARVAWRSEQEAGLEFIAASSTSVIPFERSRGGRSIAAKPGSSQ